MKPRKDVADFLDKALPSNLEAERLILGAILLDNQTLGQASEILTAEDFFLDSHQRIYKAMMRLKTAAKPIDPVTLQNALRNADELTLMGGPAFVGQLIDGVPRFSNIHEYCLIVLERSIERSIVKECQHAQNKILDQESAGSVIGDLEVLIAALKARAASHRKGRSLASCVELAIEELRAIRRGEGQLRYRSGFAAIDAALGGGFAPGYMLIGARTSQGKSTLALQFALEGARAQPDAIGCIFSLEMRARELGHRVLNIRTGIEDKYYKSARFTSAEKEQILTTHDELQARKIEVFDEPLLTPSLFLSTAMAYKRTAGGLNYAVIDYLALMTEDGNPSSKRFEQIINLSRQMKIAQMVLDVPVFTPVQLKPQADTDDRDLRLTDIAEGDALARDADIVFLLQRKEDMGAFVKYKIDAAKNRGGRCFTTRLDFNKLCGRFETTSETKAAPVANAYEYEE